MHYLLSSLVGYLLGSVPTAYILLKKKKGIDITTAGSGNVGAMNSYEVTNSRIFGIIVLFVDFLKGLLSVVIISLIYPDNFVLPALSLIFAIFSHCYNPWIGFKGGRGLATAAGGSVLLFPVLPVAWIILWVIIYMLKKDILIANIAATVFSLLLIFNTATIAVKYSFPAAGSEAEMILFVLGGLMIIFIKHIEPFKEILSNLKKTDREHDKP